jgi:hypothetical protein
MLQLIEQMLFAYYSFICCVYVTADRTDAVCILPVHLLCTGHLGLIHRCVRSAAACCIHVPVVGVVIQFLL